MQWAQQRHKTAAAISTAVLLMRRHHTAQQTDQTAQEIFLAMVLVDTITNMNQGTPTQIPLMEARQGEQKCRDNPSFEMFKQEETPE